MAARTNHRRRYKETCVPVALSRRCPRVLTAPVPHPTQSALWLNMHTQTPIYMAVFLMSLFPVCFAVLFEQVESDLAVHEGTILAYDLIRLDDNQVGTHWTSEGD